MLLHVIFSAPFAVTLLQLCIQSSHITMTLILKLMTPSPADMEEGSPGHNALSTLMLLHACMHLKLWVFLNLAESAPRGWRQEAYLLPLGRGGLRQYIWFWQKVLEKLIQN